MGTCTWSVVTVLLFIDLIPILNTYANSADQVQMPHVASYHGLHSLFTETCMLNTVKNENFDEKPLKVEMVSSK